MRKYLLVIPFAAFTLTTTVGCDDKPAPVTDTQKPQGDPSKAGMPKPPPIPPAPKS
jgi:hypothetical protein